MQSASYSESSTWIFFLWSLFALGVTVGDILIVGLLDTGIREENRLMSFHFAFLIWILVKCKRYIYTMPCTLVTLDFQRARAFHCGPRLQLCRTMALVCLHRNAFWSEYKRLSSLILYLCESANSNNAFQKYAARPWWENNFLPSFGVGLFCFHTQYLTCQNVHWITHQSPHIH